MTGWTVDRAATVLLEAADGRTDLSLPDVVADKASSGYFVTGPKAVPPASLDLGLEACLLVLNGQAVDSATGAAVQGHPAEAPAWPPTT